jgi:DNA-binding transcriptional ArsR family regulator
VQRRKTGTRRQRQPADTERRLATTWAKAHRRVVERPPVADHFTVRAELAELLATADTDPAAWRGTAGVTNRAVLGALAEIASAACTLTPSASTRQLAEAANVAAGTAWCALRRLATAGWIRPERPATGTEAASWRLLRPDTASQPTDAVAEVLEALPPRPAAPPGGRTRSHDVFTHPIHGGLGRVAARVFDLLDDGIYGGLSLGQLTALSGLHPRTVTRHLDSLQAAGLVSVGRLSGGWARSATAGDPDRLAAALDEAAAALGCTGVTAERRARHAAQRDAYTAWWTDFHARAGWAVQRGRYPSSRRCPCRYPGPPKNRPPALEQTVPAPRQHAHIWPERARPAGLGPHRWPSGPVGHRSP